MGRLHKIPLTRRWREEREVSGHNLGEKKKANMGDGRLPCQLAHGLHARESFRTACWIFLSDGKVGAKHIQVREYYVNNLVITKDGCMYGWACGNNGVPDSLC